MNATDVLLRAAELIENEGHWKPDDGFPREGHCVVTAIQAQEPGLDAGPRAADVVREYVKVHGWRCIGDWSDAHSRIHIVAKLRQLAPLAHRVSREDAS